MMDWEREVKKSKRTNTILFCAFTGLLLLAVLLGAVAPIRRHFTTKKWLEHPQERTRIVGDLLEKHPLVGMTAWEIEALLGEDDGEMGYFTQEDRMVYWLGPERGLISIDSEWLILEFSEGLVQTYYLTTD